jgi:hypothetical protein
MPPLAKHTPNYFAIKRFENKTSAFQLKRMLTLKNSSITVAKHKHLGSYAFSL